MYELNIDGMSCGHCVQAVTRAIRSRDADAEVHVDLAAGKARLETRLSPDEACAALAEEGYAATPAGEPA